MEGDCFKRPRYGDKTPEEQIWLERRNISFNADSHDFQLLFSKELPGKVEQDLRKLFPVYRFLLSTAQETLRQETERELRRDSAKGLPFQEKRASRRKGLDALFDSRRLQDPRSRLDGL